MATNIKKTKKIIDYDYLRKEYVKCVMDKSRIYMIQHFLKTFDGTQGKEVPFMLFPRQQVLCKTLGYGDASIATTKYRQAGITTVTAGFISCQTILASPESPITVLIIGNTLDLAQQMLEKIKNFLLQFPLWMWGDEFDNQGYDMLAPPENTNVIFDKCNGKEILVKNGCKIYARSSGPNASRGISACHYLIFDECAFIENGGDVYTAALPTTSSVHGKAIFVSTPNGKDKLYYETCRRAKLKGTDDWNNFDLVEMFWYQDPRYNRFLEWYKKNEETGEIEIIKEPVVDKLGNVKYDEEKWNGLIKQGYKPRSPWYITMCQQFNNDEQKIAQELDVSFLGSASNVVAPEFIEMQEKLNMRDPDPTYRDPFVDETWLWKWPIPGHRYIMGIDCSRGDAADRTAIEICDMDAIDDDGKPCIEQVFEYHGKRTGDEIGEMAVQYGHMYGDAFCTVDCIGGTGDACILMMQRLGYENLYYDDPNLKTYTIQREATSLPLTPEGKLPGFHSQSVRFQMLTSFANMVKTNQIKIRSKRVIQELETWIYKGEAARIDHMDGCHDDTLTCLAMAMFVMQHSLGKIKAAMERDAAFLKAWVNTAMITARKEQPRYGEREEYDARPKEKFVMPFYTNTTASRTGNPQTDALMWLIK